PYVTNALEDSNDFADERAHCAQSGSHGCSSATQRLRTNGVSFARASERPLRILIQSVVDSIRMSATNITSTPVTEASRRSLKINCDTVCVGLPAAFSASCCACARNPMRGFGSRILRYDAVNVTDTSQASGARVTSM